MEESKGWQGRPDLIKYRSRLIDRTVRDMEINGLDFEVVAAEEREKNRNWYRASGEVVCELCGLKYYQHPPYPFSYDKKSFVSDTELCNGDLVHF